MKINNLTKRFFLLLLLSFTGISVVHASAYIQPGANNSTNTRGACGYELKDNFWAVIFWSLPTPAAVFNAAWSPCAACTTSEILRVKWKNVKANAYPSSLTV
ncbi:MAG: hypothetical protein JZU47_09500 [Prolixibacteraceae bacterium]|nr:hypothetical protein [Prolixibacteraceae bacterium]